MNEQSLPWLDLESARLKAAAIREEKEEAIQNYEAAVKKAAEKKREHRKAEALSLVRALKEGNGATIAARIAKLDTGQQEFEAALAEGMVQVAKERLEQAKEDLWSLRHFSERSGSIEGWGGQG